MAGAACTDAAYGNVYGMEKTTVYLPGRLKAAVKRAAAAAGSSEATVIREALERATTAAATPRPRLPLFRSRQTNLAEAGDEALAGDGGPGFGTR